MSERPFVSAKFLWAGGKKLYVCGVTYGPFRPDDAGCEYGDPRRVDADLAAIAASGANAIRTYTVPPRWLLDVAARRGLRVMVGIPWEQHIAFLDRVTSRAAHIEAAVRAGVRACAGHPAGLCYAVGNEIPAGIVRWSGQRRIARFLERLCRAAKEEDPGCLVTYVNYPSTEYLHLPFVDFVSFNIYLESVDRLQAYLARLHNLAGAKPLLVAELGLDSEQHGEERQAASIAQQVGTAFSSGCCGTFVFAWTDEWHRGGEDVVGWSFGVTDRERRSKLALSALQGAYRTAPFSGRQSWPRISVVVCSYQGARTIGECLSGLGRLDYPDYEVIVVDDGSTDATPHIARAHAARVVRTTNRGLSAARNTGLTAATGEIVAYIDDDAAPDPHWLRYLAIAFETTDHAGIGGPNLPPPDDDGIAECVAQAPGGPIHVLLTDVEAEHIPGCNMAFRRDALRSISGFDTQFRIAGDDVDVCWRLQQAGYTLGFHPAAVVWHRRRPSVAAFWKQQLNYGCAEALLEQKWPEKYNALGHLTWRGRLYGAAFIHRFARRWRVYYGVWGTGLFQSIYEPAPGLLHSLPVLPEWYLLLACLAVMSLLGIGWSPLLFALPLLGIAVTSSAVHAANSARHATFARARRWRRTQLQLIVTVLHLVQPLARLVGRIRSDLTPWRRRGEVPRIRAPLSTAIWNERWRSAEDWLGRLETALRGSGVRVRRGSEFDRWDLEVQHGSLGAARTLLAIEEHGQGRQLVRLRVLPRLSSAGILTAGLLAVLVGAAVSAHALPAALLLGSAAVALTWRMLRDGATAAAAAVAAVASLDQSLVLEHDTPAHGNGNGTNGNGAHANGAHGNGANGNGTNGNGAHANGASSNIGVSRGADRARGDTVGRVPLRDGAHTRDASSRLGDASGSTT